MKYEFDTEEEWNEAMEHLEDYHDCEKRIKKSETAKTIARIFIQNKSELKRKEQMK